MAFAAKAILKPISVATNCSSVSVQSLFTPSKASFPNPSLSIQIKPIKFQREILLSLERKEPLFKSCVIAARHEEGGPVVLEEKEEEVGGSLGLDVSENGAECGEGELGLEEAKVYVGNLPYDVDSETLAKLFQQAGVVEMSEIIYDRETDRSRGFGFVTMRTVEEAEKAVEMFHRYDLNGRSLAVYIAAPRGSRPKQAPRALQPAYRVYVGNLPWNVDDSHLLELFSKHGKVLSARVFTDRETGRSRGFGFVLMQTESERNDAIASLNGQSVDGRAIRVDVAEEKPRPASF